MASAPTSLGTLADRLRPLLAHLRTTSTSPAPPSTVHLDEQLATRRQTRKIDLHRLQDQAQKVRQEIDDLRARTARLSEEAAHLDDDLASRQAQAATEDQAVLLAYLGNVAHSFDAGMSVRSRLQQSVDTARTKAVERVGPEPVLEYEAIRRRIEDLSEHSDRLDRDAYGLLERDRRAALRDYAVALDQLAAAPPVLAPFVAFSASDGNSTVLVAPVRASVPLSPGDPRTGLACSLWQAAERAAQELAGGALVVHGTVADLLAVQCGPCDLDLLEVLVTETLAGRPSLDALGVDAGFETVRDVVPPWVEALETDAPDEEAELVAVADGAQAGHALPNVALRLGLSLRDLVAALHEHGLPFPDDVIDAGAEETLRVLVGIAPVGSPPSSEPESSDWSKETSSAPMVPALQGNLGIASRLLAKLLRDRRVGGRHTRMDNAWGHHFADGEKQTARRVAEWLERDGIFIPKNNEGSHHISINPRRLRDVRQIIEGTWARREEVEAG